MLALIRAIHAEVKGAYGSPRMVRELRARGFSAGQGTGRTADARERHPCPPQAALQGHDRFEARAAGGPLLARNFTPTAPNQVWTSDITYLWTDEGWLYLAIVLDLFNREVVGWSLKPRMTADIVTDALTMVSTRRTHL
jgi:putative transposase